jgi:predicted nucleic acid-binding Zn ribbon protein
VKRTRETSKLIPLADALGTYLKQAGLTKRVGQAGVMEEWPELVGAQIARVTQPESVSADGQLRVRVATAGWAAELQLMTPQILARLNTNRSGRITAIRWVAGTVVSRQSPVDRPAE